MAQELTIGKIAKLGSTLRRSAITSGEAFYRSPKSSYGIPPLSSGHREHIRFIKRAQALGFTLNEIAVLMKMEEARACGMTRRLALDKINAIDQKLAGLTSMRKTLAALLRQCNPGGSK
jgi:MerR family mercuric resistance operon transcriptional regulator